MVLHWWTYQRGNWTWWRAKRRSLCERVLYRHGAILLFLHVRMEFSTRRFRPNGGWSPGQRRWRNERRDNERSDTWWHVDVPENTRCEGVLSTSPVGYSRSLSTVHETNCNRKGEIWAKSTIMWAHFQLHSDAYHHEELEVEGQYCHPVCWSIRAPDM